MRRIDVYLCLCGLLFTENFWRAIEKRDPRVVRSRIVLGEPLERVPIEVRHARNLLEKRSQLSALSIKKGGN
jgi:hypothetical protein